MICKIADFIIEFNNNFSNIKRTCEAYILSEQKPMISLFVSDYDFLYEQKHAQKKYSRAHLEISAFYRQLAEWLPLHGAFVLHSACFDVDGVGVVFAAHSGTGKTTHMRLWQKYLGDKMVVVNGDKPIVRFFEDEPDIPYAYGTPWNGKEHLGCNMRTPLKHICFIERSETNYVESVNKKSIIDRIFNQVYMPKDPQAVLKTMQMIDRLISCCDLWIIHCNMEEDAAKVAYETIFKV